MINIWTKTCYLSHFQVVQRAFEFVPDQNWELIKPLEFAEKWTNFGSAKYKHIGKKCIYAIPEIDRTDGFFVAILERTFGDKPQPFTVEKLAPHVLNNLSLSNNGTSNHHEEEQVAENDEEEQVQEVPVDLPSSSKKKRQKNTSVSEAINGNEVPEANTTIEESPGDAENKKKKKRKSKGGDVSQDVIDISLTEDKPKKNKKSKAECIEILTDTEEPSPHDNGTVADSAKKSKKKRKIEETVAVSTPTDKKKKKK